MQVSDTPRLDSRWALPGQLAHAMSPSAQTTTVRRTARDWTVDTAFFLVGLLGWFAGLALAVPATDELSTEVTTGLTATAPVFPTSWTPLEVVDPVLGGLLCLALWWRRRFPVSLAIASVVLSSFSVTTGGATLVLLFTVAVHRPWPISTAVGAAHIPTSLLYNELHPDPGTSLLSMLLVGTLVMLVILSWGIVVRARRQLVLSLRTRADQERREHELRLQDAGRAERERMAREMHDVLAHRISLLSVHAGALEYRTRQAEAGNAPALSGAEVQEAVAVIRENAHQALEELREVLTVLRSDPAPSAPEPGAQDTAARGTAQGGTSDQSADAPQPAVADLANLVAEAQAAGQQVHLVTESPGIETTRPQLQRTVYRVVQEGLTNARKHAPDALVHVSVTGTPEAGIEVTLANVVAIDAVESVIPGSGVGLAGLGERVAIEGGALTHGIRGGAFRLRAELPWRA